MKNITKRHQFILERLKDKGQITIPELIDLTEVSGVTIRKDLKFLEDKGLIFITRGGASLTNPYTIDRPIYEKATINAEQKKRIAQAAVKLIGQNDAIIIGSGTTAFEFAHQLHPATPLTVITPAVRVTMELCNRPNVEVLQLGGLIRPNSSSVAGSYAEYMLDRVSCGVLFIGVDGIDLDFGFSISNLTEANINQKMINTSQVVVVLADSTKFGKRGIGKICELEQVQYIVTDNGVSETFVKELEERGLKVIVAK
ncbi:DeoR family transcriptional regulator, aga operon transcriptional repressor [Parapedobacter composti]|uniref:DeoR family transcriptional regulator, aga operon transcriptional repressor n=1 Tax=Parapedobacter composti TaxID=623281 RepID=A0A1I1F481_9SPHI|nr:DeoR/GlpR family DNA-binding transcription regulator [Parapedobacter composti]SFB93756.1 DeoR family transcriptional regulator, aga operon transcriptional repressor [Parapedobacter composti]